MPCVLGIRVSKKRGKRREREGENGERKKENPEIYAENIPAGPG
jgi:hypothetical protein